MTKIKTWTDVEREHGYWAGMKDVLEIMESTSGHTAKNRWKILKSLLEACLQNRSALEEVMDNGGHLDLWVDKDCKKIVKIGNVWIEKGYEDESKDKK